MLDPFQQPCTHAATPEEQQRDPDYRGCFAPAGTWCTWARRRDGITNPVYHSERWELAAQPAGEPVSRIDPAQINAYVLADGEV